VFTPYSPLWAVLCLVIAGLTAGWLQGKWVTLPALQGQQVQLLGLRGVLSCCIYVGHAAVWVGYLEHGRWEVPPSLLYTYLVQVSVSMFFMLTAYLFTTRFLSSGETPVDWLDLYWGRFLKLVPSYWLVMLLLFALTGLAARLMHTAATTPLSDYAHWLAFAIAGTPALHGINDTSVAMANATWIFAYEWIFYFSLPVLALLLGRRAPLWLAGTGVGLGAIIAMNIANYLIAYSMFVIGIVSALLSRRATLATRLARPKGALLYVASLCAAAMASPNTAYAYMAVFFVGLAFLIVASGNTLGGALVHRASQVLGLASYSLFLLHGMLLYTGILVAKRIPDLRLEEPVHFWLLVAGLTPILVLLSLACYRFVELPALGMRGKIRAIFPRESKT